MTAPLCDERSSEGSARALQLSDIDAAAKVYASSYVSPHHITFTVAGLRNLIASLASPSPQLSSLSLEGERDKQRLDWLEAQGKDRQGRPMPWIARQSVIDRGFRLHNDWDAPHLTARKAIDAAMKPQS